MIKSNLALLHQALQSADNAYEMYLHFRDLPKSATRQLITNALDVKVNGPVLDNPKILSACDGSGKPCIVKVLKRPCDSLLSLGDRDKEIAMETEACDILELREPKFAFVSASLKTIAIPADDAKYYSVGSGFFTALIMPMYPLTVAKCAGFNREVLAREGERIMDALSFVHSKSLVHMDVKGHNIFMDSDGRWVLGDFGSCTKIGEKITSCSDIFYFEKLLNKEALPKYDMYMLMITLLIETLSDKHNFASELQGENIPHVDKNIVEAKVKEVCRRNDKLSILMRKLLTLSQ